MTHGLVERSPLLPLGIDVLSIYATHTTGSNCVAVAIRNNTSEWVAIDKGVPIARMEAANMIPPVDGSLVTSASQPIELMSNNQHQEALMEKLDLSGLNTWDEELATQARNLPREYHEFVLSGKA